MIEDKIKKLFDELTVEEQNSLLLDLNKSKKKLEINTTDISSFAAKHQKQYGKDITFTISKSEENDTITAVIHTIYGNFTGTGSNQKIAKVNAVKIANEEWG